MKRLRKIRYQWAICLSCFCLDLLSPLSVLAQKLPGQIRFGTENELRTKAMFAQPSVLYGALNYLSGRVLVKPIHKHDAVVFKGRDLYVARMEEICKARQDCFVDGNRVVYPGLSFDFRIGTDATTLELTHTPLTTTEILRLQSIIQHDMFDVPKSLGLRVSTTDWIGAGHLHMDLGDAFGDDARLFRNFVVDFLNHWELYYGVLGYDPMEGKDILKTRAVQEFYRRTIQDFDDGRIQGLEALRLALANIGFRKVSYTTQKPALNLDTKHGTIEFRAVRSYRSAYHMYQVMRLMELRLHLLKTKADLVPIQDHLPSRSNRDIQVLTFYRYVRELGLSWDEYRFLLPETYKAHEFDFDRENFSRAESPWYCRRVVALFSL